MAQSIEHVLAADLFREFPHEPSRPLAGILYKKHKDQFETLDAAYSKIRYIRGAAGTKNRAAIAGSIDSDLIRPPQSSSTTYHLPKERQDLDWEPAKINGTKFLCISDIHLPY